MQLKNPFMLFISGFVILILLGSLLLFLPAANKKHFNYLDALFTSASAVCVTGLVVNDPGRDFTLFGQWILLVLFQMGGLGILTFSSLFIIFAGGTLHFSSRQALQDAFSPTAFSGFNDFIKRVVLFTFAIEIGGTLLFFSYFSGSYSPGRALFFSVFHAVSAFCNAGFSLFSSSFTASRNNAGINMLLMVLIIIGGIGFTTLFDVWRVMRGKRKVLKLQSKGALLISGILVAGGALLLFLAERGNAESSGLACLFQAVTARTAGFNTMDLSRLSLASILVLLVLMFIGASSGSTGGGLKTNTFFIIILTIKRYMLNQERSRGFNRAVPERKVLSAFVLLSLFLSFIVIGTVILAFSEKFSLREILFEVVSALGTVGLSLGITSALSPVGKLVIILLMFCGRVGPLLLLEVISYKKKALYNYPYEEIMIG